MTPRARRRHRAGHDPGRRPSSTCATSARRYAGLPALRLTTAKVFLDGVIEFPAQTAALLSPYLDADGRPTDDYGDLYVAGPAFGRLAAALDRAGWQVHSHAIGDRAVRVALDGYEAALAATAGAGPGTRSRTSQLVHPDDHPPLRAARRRRLACSCSGPIRNVFTLDALQPYIGQQRFDRLYPARSLARAGARLAGGSDWPVDPFRPFNQIATRRRPHGPGPGGRPAPAERRGVADPRAVAADAHARRRVPAPRRAVRRSSPPASARTSSSSTATSRA